MSTAPDGPAPWRIRAASARAESSSLAGAVPAGQPASIKGARTRAGGILTPDTSPSAGTKDADVTYISHPSADTQGEGAKQTYVNDSDYSNKEHIAGLVEQAKAGKKEAFEEIYRLHHEPLFRYAKYRLGKYAAEDAVAETFLRAWQGLPRYRATGAPFVSWLYGIARHVVLDAGNADRRVEPRGEFPDYAVEPALGAVEHIALSDAIQALPEKQRQVIEMKFILGLRNEEVGVVLKKSPGAVNALQWRALESLKKILERR